MNRVFTTHYLCWCLNGILAACLSACHMGSALRGKTHLMNREFIPLYTTPYACSHCQKALGHLLPDAYRKNRAVLESEKKELGDFGPYSS